MYSLWCGADSTCPSQERHSLKPSWILDDSSVVIPIIDVVQVEKHVLSAHESSFERPHAKANEHYGHRHLNTYHRIEYT